MKASLFVPCAYHGPSEGSGWPTSASVYSDEAAQATFETALAQCRLADEVGFDWVTVAEHHYAPFSLEELRRRLYAHPERQPAGPPTPPTALARQRALVERLSRPSREETERLFAALGKGGAVAMPLQDTFWGAYFGMLTDKFGIQWMMNCELKK